jgi:hypothetical protein
MSHSGSLVLFALLSLACRGKSGVGVLANTVGNAGTGPVENASALRAPPPATEPLPVPVGISLPVQPGKGLGPVRFGATVATIERLMGRPCDEREALPAADPLGATEECRFFAQAVDYAVGPQGVVRMHVHRTGSRRKADGRSYGVFNGRFLEGVTLGMVPDAVVEGLGRPLRVERPTEPGPFGVREVHHYAGFRLEFERAPNGDLVLGGIELMPPATQ